MCASLVIAPPSKEAKPAVYPICKDSIKSEYLEDDEEWVWTNAASARGQVRNPRTALPRTTLDDKPVIKIYAQRGRRRRLRRA